MKNAPLEKITTHLERLTAGYVVVGDAEDDDPCDAVRIADSDDRGLYDTQILLGILEGLNRFDDEEFWEALSEAEVL